MRYVLGVLAVLLLVWHWRSTRAAALLQRQQAATNHLPIKGTAQPMVACGLCGVHVPAADAIKGADGSYCSMDHHRQARD